MWWVLEVYLDGSPDAALPTRDDLPHRSVCDRVCRREKFWEATVQHTLDIGYGGRHVEASLYDVKNDQYGNFEKVLFGK